MNHPTGCIGHSPSVRAFLPGRSTKKMTNSAQTAGVNIFAMAIKGASGLLSPSPNQRRNATSHERPKAIRRKIAMFLICMFIQRTTGSSRLA